MCCASNAQNNKKFEHIITFVLLLQTNSILFSSLSPHNGSKEGSTTDTRGTEGRPGVEEVTRVAWTALVALLAEEVPQLPEEEFRRFPAMGAAFRRR